MSWLRIDDGYDTHPKLLELTELQRWRWTRVLLHCARHRTEGHVKPSVLREIGLGRAIGQLVTLGLLHENGDTGYLVHDWLIYNADTIGGKVAAFLAENPDATANDVHRAVGGKREIVLAEVAVQRGSREPEGNQKGTAREPLTGGSREPLLPVPNRYPSGSRARAPVPSPSKEPSNLPLDAEEGGHGYTPEELERLAADVLHEMPA